MVLNYFNLYKKLIILLLALTFFACETPVEELTFYEGEESDPITEIPVDEQSFHEENFDEENQEDESLEDSSPTIPEKDEISEEEKDPLPPPVKPNPLANFSEIELKLMETPFETALDNSLVMLLFSDPDEWFYYNQMKQDREYPNAAKIYEGIIKMICAGSYVKGEIYPRKYAFDSYPEFTHDYDNAIRAVEYDHPEFFYLQLCHTYYSWNGDKVIFHVEGLYDSLEELRADEIRAYEGSFDRIEEFKERMIQYKNRPYPTESETLKGSALVDEQIRWLHDAYAYAWYYHSTNFDYRIGQSAYGMLTQRRGVCEGMSLSLLYFAKILNIDATIVVVTGDMSNGYHAWNAYLKSDGTWFEIDPTSDALYNIYGGPRVVYNYRDQNNRYFPNSPNYFLK